MFLGASRHASRPMQPAVRDGAGARMTYDRKARLKTKGRGSAGAKTSEFHKNLTVYLMLYRSFQRMMYFSVGDGVTGDDVCISWCVTICIAWTGLVPLCAEQTQWGIMPAPKRLRDSYRRRGREKHTCIRTGY